MGTAGENFCDSAAISLKILAVPWLKFTQYTLRILRPDRPGHLLLRAPNGALRAVSQMALRI